MSIYIFTIDSDHVDGQPFVIESDDLVGATMAAIEFVRELDQKTSERLNEPGVRESRIIAVQDTRALWANKEGIEKYLEDFVNEYEEEED